MMIRKKKFLSEMQENEWAKAYGYPRGRKQVDIYKRGEESCEVESGKYFIHSILFRNGTGHIMGFHNFKTGRSWYPEKIKEIADKCTL